MQSKFDFKKTIVSHKMRACPIAYEQVDKYLIKSYSSVLLFVLFSTLFIGNYWLLYLITLDFIIRVFAGIKYSPLCNILIKSMKVISLKPVLINAGTKKIAAQVGLFFCMMICLFHLLSWYFTVKIFLLIFIFAIAIDLFFDYCLVCKMQSFYLSYFKRWRL